MRYLLDTNICVYALKHRPPEVLERLRAVGKAAVAVSVITVLELRQGAEKSQQPAANHGRLDLFLAPLRVLPFDEEAALAGARVRAHLERLGRPIGDLDSLIAAQALARQMILVTNNLREFERVPGLSLENWVS
ncbi:MAG: type II toxin-antitoxin system tRNA(fMet)-specific endonuclease VapC [Thermoanaerobaculia bacterium]